ncbi:MAG: molybdopterin-dependent oxidoreductase [Deltaproteobacteria bacterium]|nr:molybdopterin-dependent oxidoreductase [Deltaproteobacteria bacterium]
MCGLRVTVEGARVTKIRGDADDVLSHGHVCPKAIALGELLHDPDRVRAPLMRGPVGWVPVAWDRAMSDIATKLRRIRDDHGPDAVGLYIGNPCVHSHRSGLASQVLGLALGTKNRFDPNSQDSNPRLFACMQVHGDALAMAVPDLARTKHLLMLGANPAASCGSQMALGDPKARFRDVRARGGKIVLVDPRRSESAAWCDEHHFIRPGGDAALLFAILHVLFRERAVDALAVDAIATGREQLARLSRSFSPSRVGPVIGIAAHEIERMARELAAEPMGSVYARVGVCQNEFGPVAAWLVEVINVVLGRFDREGGVILPTPAADVAPLGRLLIGNHHGRWRSRVRGLPEMLGAIPSATMAEEMETPGDGQIKALVVLAGNPVATTPNGPRLAKAIAGLELVVCIDYYVQETARLAHYVLPSQHVFETGNFDLVLSRFAVRNVAKYSPPILTTEDDTRDDFDIAQELAARVLLGRALPRALSERLRAMPERVIDWLLQHGAHRLSLDQLAKAEHGVDLGPIEPSASRHERRHVLAPDALVRDVPRLEAWVDAGPGDGLVLIGRRHLRSNNSWMHNLPALAKGPDRARLLVHPDDAITIGATGTIVRVTSRAGSVEAVLETSDTMMRGVVSLPHGFGQSEVNGTLRVAGALPGPSANALTDELVVEPVLGTSILNGVPVALAPVIRGASSDAL